MQLFLCCVGGLAKGWACSSLEVLFSIDVHIEGCIPSWVVLDLAGAVLVVPMRLTVKQRDLCIVHYFECKPLEVFMAPKQNHPSFLERVLQCNSMKPTVLVHFGKAVQDVCGGYAFNNGAN